MFSYSLIESHPKERFRLGESLFVAVRSVDALGRIFVSHRELLGTWEQNAARFTPGQTVAGIVRSVEEYGVFVELAPNLAGLAEVRDCDREAVHSLIGRTAAVFIKSIIPERMKVKLVLIDPKKVEFGIYKGIPHLLAPIVTAPKDAAGALQAAVEEMENRFEIIEAN